MCKYLLSVTREKINNSKWNKAFLPIKHINPDSSKIKFYKNKIFNLKFRLINSYIFKIDRND
jgi:hypothetical protein